MKCDNCGYKVNPGDQICINCGAKLSLNNTYMPEVGENYPKEENNKKFLILVISGVILLICIVFLIIKFIFFK